MNTLTEKHMAKMIRSARQMPSKTTGSQSRVRHAFDNHHQAQIFFQHRG